MSKDKQIKTTIWLTKGIPKEQLEREKEEAIKEARAELRKIDIEEMAKAIDKSPWRIEQDFTGCHINSTEMAEHLYNAGYRKQSEWISVEDGLPDKEGTYLTYTDKDNVDLDIFCIYPSHGTKFWSGERRGKVTHWMPLPEAPKIRLWS